MTSSPPASSSLVAVPPLLMSGDEADTEESPMVTPRDTVITPEGEVVTMEKHSGDLISKLILGVSLHLEAFYDHLPGTVGESETFLS